MQVDFEFHSVKSRAFSSWVCKSSLTPIEERSERVKAYIQICNSVASGMMRWKGVRGTRYRGSRRRLGADYVKQRHTGLPKQGLADLHQAQSQETHFGFRTETLFSSADQWPIQSNLGHLCFCGLPILSPLSAPLLPIRVDAADLSSNWEAALAGWGGFSPGPKHAIGGPMWHWNYLVSRTPCRHNCAAVAQNARLMQICANTLIVYATMMKWVYISHLLCKVQTDWDSKLAGPQWGLNTNLHTGEVNFTDIVCGDNFTTATVVVCMTSSPKLWCHGFLPINSMRIHALAINTH